jgi:hypothetical protein
MSTGTEPSPQPSSTTTQPRDFIPTFLLVFVEIAITAAALILPWTALQIFSGMPMSSHLIHNPPSTLQFLAVPEVFQPKGMDGLFQGLGVLVHTVIVYPMLSLLLIATVYAHASRLARTGRISPLVIGQFCFIVVVLPAATVFTVQQPIYRDRFEQRFKPRITDFEYKRLRISQAKQAYAARNPAQPPITIDVKNGQFMVVDDRWSVYSTTLTLNGMDIADVTNERVLIALIAYDTHRERQGWSITSPESATGWHYNATVSWQDTDPKTGERRYLLSTGAGESASVDSQDMRGTPMRTSQEDLRAVSGKATTVSLRIPIRTADAGRATGLGIRLSGWAHNEPIELSREVIEIPESRRLLSSALLTRAQIRSGVGYRLDMLPYQPRYSWGNDVCIAMAGVSTAEPGWHNVAVSATVRADALAQWRDAQIDMQLLDADAPGVPGLPLFADHTAAATPSFLNYRTTEHFERTNDAQQSGESAFQTSGASPSDTGHAGWKRKSIARVVSFDHPGPHATETLISSISDNAAPQQFLASFRVRSADLPRVAGVHILVRSGSGDQTRLIEKVAPLRASGEPAQIEACATRTQSASIIANYIMAPPQGSLKQHPAGLSDLALYLAHMDATGVMQMGARYSVTAYLISEATADMTETLTNTIAQNGVWSRAVFSGTVGVEPTRGEIRLLQRDADGDWREQYFLRLVTEASAVSGDHARFSLAIPVRRSMFRQPLRMVVRITPENSAAPPFVAVLPLQPFQFSPE